MLNPDYWGKDLKIACTLTLRLKCESTNEADRIRALILEVLREYKIPRRVYKFEVEK